MNLGMHTPSLTTPAALDIYSIYVQLYDTPLLLAPSRRANRS